ncbi:MAG: hypothetical protein U0T79_15450 [Ferruginibacter sp.]
MTSCKTWLSGAIGIIGLLLSISCKKELEVPNTSILNEDSIQTIKTWYSQQTENIVDEGSKLNLSLKTFKKTGSIEWEKATYDKLTHGFTIPISISEKSPSDLIKVHKYLVLLINENGSVKSGQYLYVISKNDSANLQIQDSNLVLDSCILSKRNFTGAYLFYDFNNNLISSFHYERGSITNLNDKLKIKRKTVSNKKNSPTESYEDPNEEGCEWITIEWYWQTYVNGELVHEEYLYSTNELVCPPGGGGNQGGNNGHNPCSGADSLANNTGFKLKFDTLKLLTASNREHGYIYRNTTANSIEAVGMQGPPDTLGVDFPSFTVPIDGFIHSHFKIPGRSLSTFSDFDINEMIKFYSEGRMSNPLTFSAGVVTADSTQYLLRIDNLTDFQSFVTKMTGSMKLLYWTRYDQYVQAGNTKEQNEIGLLKFFSAFGSAVKLFKGNSNFTNWQPIKLNSSQEVVPAPCN